MSINTQVIRAEPHAEIGSLILRDADMLVERWCLRAKEELPSAERVHEDVLRDQLPVFLRAMGRSLAQRGATDQVKASAVEHGEQRWDNGWSIAALVRDYQLLQLVILEHLEQSLNRRLEYREVMAVGVFIDDAVAASIDQFATNRDERVRQISNERRDALEEASRRKDEFIAMLAHELRNPLAPIVNSVELLQMLLAAADQGVLDLLEVIKRQSRFMTCLVDDLLDLARIAQGRLALRKEQLEITPVIDQAVQACDPTMRDRGHRLTVELPAEPLYLEADRARLLQVLVNLLNNAAKYTDAGGEIGLSAFRDENDAVFQVRDNGIGISPDMLSRVFELFVQGEGLSKDSQGGLGIGLTLVRRLVDLHGGTIVCRSAGLGQGSEFVVRLPSIALGQEIREYDMGSEPEGVAACHILVIEDQADTRLVLTKLLIRLGHRVDFAEDGVSGIRLAIASRPQVALVDIGLPDTDGYGVAKQLRTALGDQIFIVALTGYAQPEDLRRALDAGFDAHLVKPMDVAQLGRLLTRARCS